MQQLIPFGSLVSGNPDYATLVLPALFQASDKPAMDRDQDGSGNVFAGFVINK